MIDTRVICDKRLIERHESTRTYLNCASVDLTKDGEPTFSWCISRQGDRVTVANRRIPEGCTTVFSRSSPGTVLASMWGRITSLTKEEGGVMLPIGELQNKLLRERQSLRGVRAHLEEDLLWLETDVESEQVERGQDETIIRLLARLDDCQKAEVEEIDRALGRVANGDYGRCEICGKSIPLSRLGALPAASSCLPCAVLKERLRHDQPAARP